MSKEAVEVIIREAVPADAADLLKLLSIIAVETPYMAMDETGPTQSIAEQKKHIDRFLASEKNLLLVAVIEDKLVAFASVSSSDKKKIEHIGGIGISILKDYWGFGLGTTMMEEIITWAKESRIIRRLELTVQARNERGIHLYEKLGFVKEGIMSRGIFDQGEFGDVVMMGLLIDE